MPFRLRSEHISERLTVEVDAQAVECQIVELAAQGHQSAAQSDEFR